MNRYVYPALVVAMGVMLALEGCPSSTEGSVGIGVAFPSGSEAGPGTPAAASPAMAVKGG